MKMSLKSAQNMYKNLAGTFLSLIKSRKEALASARDIDSRSFAENYFYPFIGVFAVSLFLGRLIHLKTFDVAELLRYSLAKISALILSYYLISVSFRYLSERYFKKNFSLQQVQTYVGLILTIDIAVGILIEFSFPEFLEALSLYIIVLLWDGSKSFFQVEEDKRLANTLITILVFFGIKWFVSFFFNKLIL